MSAFQDMVTADTKSIFLNSEEFATLRTIWYDGEQYENIPVVLTGLKQQDRQQPSSDHASGLYLVTSVLHCALSDLGGRQPEKGCRLRISDEQRGECEFYVAESTCEMEMLRIELEAIDE